jgi:REP element-mobilizing transposase RayT
MILSLIKKNSQKFQVTVYEYAIQGNHMHLLVKARSREDLQNFFRVLAGHTAQKILKEYPLKQNAGGAPDQAKTRAPRKPGCMKNQRRFWSYLIYSRVVSWGREFKTVLAYIQKNTLELLKMITYEPRLKKTLSHSS